MDDSPSVLQCVLFGGLGLLALVPMFSLICKTSTLREFSAELMGRTQDSSEEEAADDIEAERSRRIAAYYELMFSRYYRRRPPLALCLSNWREDIRRHRLDCEILPTTLQKIQLPPETSLRYEPPIFTTGAFAPQELINVGVIHSREQGHHRGSSPQQ